MDHCGLWAAYCRRGVGSRQHSVQGVRAGDIIARSGAKAVLVQKGFLAQDYTAPAGIPVIDLKSDFLSSGAPFERTIKSTDVADIIFTSGTTGRPKGLMMNHQQTLRMYEEWATLADLREGDRYLMINPYFHTFGLKAGLIASFCAARRWCRSRCSTLTRW